MDNKSINQIGEKMTEEQLQKEDVNYKPLTHGLFIEESLIDGQGLFASEPIEEEIDLGISHYEVEPDKLSDKILIRTPLGGFINHQPIETKLNEEKELIEISGPNCEKIKNRPEGNKTEWNLVARKDIQAGEELTLEYSFYDPL